MKKTKTIFLLSLFSVLAGSFFISCGGPDGTKQAPTFGKLKFGSDVSLNAMVDYEKKVFQHFYPDAKLSPQYMDENDMFASFINDSVRLIFALRDFTAKEKQWLKDRKIIPYSTVIGLEGIALITNPENTDTCLNVSDFFQLLPAKVIR